MGEETDLCLPLKIYRASQINKKHKSSVYIAKQERERENCFNSIFIYSLYYNFVISRYKRRIYRVFL